MIATARRSLWDLDVDRDVSIVGCCWTAAERRRLTDKLLRGRSQLGDFELHPAVAELCARRNKVSAALRRAETATNAALHAQIAELNAGVLRAQQRRASWRCAVLAERDALRAQRAALRGRVTAQETLIPGLRERQMPSPAPQPRTDRPVPPAPHAPAAIRTIAAPPPGAPRRTLAAGTLRSTRALCVGGIDGQAPQHRERVERQGGRLAHHDGDIEGGAHRLDAELAADDAVLCRPGCLNHNAYARVKAHCKRSGKPCVDLDKPGIGSFLRGLVQLRRAAYG